MASTVLSSEQHPIVGRRREQELLRACLARILDGHGQLVLVSGEAGIGKTALVEIVARDAAEQGMLVLRGGCYDLTATPPYGPWVEITRDYPTTDDTLPALPDQLRRGGGTAGIGSQAELFDLIQGFFIDVSSKRSVLLVIEDLHWADSASLELLRLLARQLIGRSILLIATYRDDELHRQDALYQLLPTLVRESRAERIELRHLDKPAVRELITVRYGLTSDDLERLTGYLYRRSDGNPLYLTELLRMLETDSQLHNVSDSWIVEGLDQSSVPALVQQVIDARLMRLGDVTRGLLEIAAVLGQEIPFVVWGEVAGIPEEELISIVQYAIDAQLIELVDGERFAHFRHALIRDTLYASIGLPVRRRWHGRAAELLVDQTPHEPDVIADHFLRAGDPRAAVWLVLAGDNARSVYAHQVAIERYTRALDHDQWLSTEQQVTALRGRAIAHENIGDFDGARIDHEAALCLAHQVDNQRAEWQALIGLGLLWSSRDYDRSGEYLRRGLEKARELDDLDAVGRTLNRLGNWHGNAGDSHTGEQLHLEALEIFQQLDDRRMLAETYDLLGMAMLFRGDHFLVANYQRQAVALFRELNDPQSLARSLLVLADLRPDFVSGTTVPAVTVADSHRYGAESIQLARQVSSRSIESWALATHGWAALSAQGEYELAFDHVRAGLALAEEIQHQQWIVYALLALGTLHFDLLGALEARLHVERALTLASQINTRFFIETATALLARLSLAEGDIVTAETLLATVPTSSDTALRQDTERKVLCARAELALARDDTVGALDIAEWLLASAPNVSTDRVPPKPAQLRAEALTQLGRFEEAEACLRELERMALDLGACSALWRLHTRLAELYWVWDRIDDAATEISIACPLIEEIAGRILDSSLSEKFRHGAIETLPALIQSTKSKTDILSRREAEVMRLVAEGITDAEVAERLFISPRTVGAHLTSIYNKLGVTSRTAATRVVLERDII